MEIRGCPFCGKKPRIERGGPNNAVWYALCDRYTHSVCVQFNGTKVEAINEWNERFKEKVSN